MKVRGFKAFYSSMTNNYGITFEEDNTYTINDNIKIKYGKDGIGYHFAKRLEDTLRYVDGMNENVYIASVIADGEIKKTKSREDEMYYEYELLEQYISSISIQEMRLWIILFPWMDIILLTD